MGDAEIRHNYVLLKSNVIFNIKFISGHCSLKLPVHCSFFRRPDVCCYYYLGNENIVESLGCFTYYQMFFPSILRKQKITWDMIQDARFFSFVYLLLHVQLYAVV
ncbi:hypothetical protein MKW92_006157 [Papaver armeniacum]|nr:hypothetical protein MKW92_006157 [Papaver armeniacum]